MKLSEISKLAFIPGNPKHGFFGTKWSPDEYRKIARAAWEGKAYVKDTGAYMGTCIFGNDAICSYRVSFDDLMADDWELVE